MHLGDIELELKSHTEEVNHVCFHPNAETTIATASDDKTIKIWDISTGTCVTTCSGHFAPGTYSTK